jgi:2-methylisocitrate lyase-like PEP mutase family enzyme
MWQPNGANGSEHKTAVEKFRALLAQKEKLIVCPGVYDGYTARIALAEDVDCLYMVSLALPWSFDLQAHDHSYYSYSVSKGNITEY